MYIPMLLLIPLLILALLGSLVVFVLVAAWFYPVRNGRIIEFIAFDNKEEVIKK